MAIPPGSASVCIRSCDIDAVAVDVLALDNDVAEIDADAEIEPLVLAAAAAFCLGLLPLHLDRAAQCIDHAVELDQQAIAHGLDQPAADARRSSARRYRSIGRPENGRAFPPRRSGSSGCNRRHQRSERLQADAPYPQSSGVRSGPRSLPAGLPRIPLRRLFLVPPPDNRLRQVMLVAKDTDARRVEDEMRTMLRRQA